MNYHTTAVDNDSHISACQLMHCYMQKDLRI